MYGWSCGQQSLSSGSCRKGIVQNGYIWQFNKSLRYCLLPCGQITRNCRSWISEITMENAGVFSRWGSFSRERWTVIETLTLINLLNFSKCSTFIYFGLWIVVVCYWLDQKYQWADIELFIDPAIISVWATIESAPIEGHCRTSTNYRKRSSITCVLCGYIVLCPWYLHIILKEC